MGMSQQVALGRGLALVLFRLAKSEYQQPPLLQGQLNVTGQETARRGALLLIVLV